MLLQQKWSGGPAGTRGAERESTRSRTPQPSSNFSFIQGPAKAMCGASWRAEMAPATLTELPQALTRGLLIRPGLALGLPQAWLPLPEPAPDLGSHSRDLPRHPRPHFPHTHTHPPTLALGRSPVSPQDASSRPPRARGEGGEGSGRTCPCRRRRRRAPSP